MATVLIIGASKGIGLEALKQALSAGHTVRALARTARRIPIEHPQLEKIDGNALDSSTVQQALAGVDAVIQSLGLSPGPDLFFRSVRLFSGATRVLVDAMKKAGTRRLICVTGFGAGDSRGRGGLLYNVAFSLLLGRAYDDKDVQEQIIRRQANRRRQLSGQGAGAQQLRRLLTPKPVHSDPRRSWQRFTGHAIDLAPTWQPSRLAAC
jgi:NAD(P)-dependent dehydrogenase (short-subunit alcohol dehydrogenase family)